MLCEEMVQRRSEIEASRHPQPRFSFVLDLYKLPALQGASDGHVEELGRPPLGCILSLAHAEDGNPLAPSRMQDFA